MKKMHNFPLSIAIIAIALFVSSPLGLAQEEPLPENGGIAGPSQADIEALQGEDIEEGLEPETAPETNEAQQSFENKKAEQDQEIKQEEADAQMEEANAEYNQSLEPEAVTEIGEPLGGVAPIEPIVIRPEPEVEEAEETGEEQD